MLAGAAAAAVFTLDAGLASAMVDETAPAAEPALPGMPVLPPLPLPGAFRDAPVPVALAGWAP